MTIYDDLADQIFAEVSAVLGPLHSAHLDRKLDSGDIHDAVILATDTPGGEPDRAARLIAAAPQLLEALELALSAFDNSLRSAGTSTAGFIATRKLLAKAQKAATAAIKAATED